MKEPLALGSYEEWKHCIVTLCGIPLTSDYVEARIAALSNPADYGTQRFVELWGAPHLERVRGWFERAGAELQGGIGAPGQ